MLITGGDTNVTTYFMLRQTVDGTAATGLTITTFDLQYTRTGDSPAVKVDATALAAVNSAHADNQMFEVDATSSPGLYRVDWPDAAFAAGVRQVHLSVKFDSTVFTEMLAVDIDPPVNVTKWLNTAVTISTTTAKPEVDMFSMSDDATAANNAELDYDGTGYDKSNSTIGTCTTNTDLVTAAAIETEIFTHVTEGAETFEQQQRIMRSESAGKVSVIGAVVTFRDAGDTKDRITSTTDINGQRTSVTVDGT